LFYCLSTSVNYKKTSPLPAFPAVVVFRAAFFSWVLAALLMLAAPYSPLSIMLTMLNLTIYLFAYTSFILL
jgi:hypothetical protein